MVCKNWYFIFTLALIVFVYLKVSKSMRHSTKKRSPGRNWCKSIGSRRIALENEGYEYFDRGNFYPFDNLANGPRGPLSLLEHRYQSVLILYNLCRCLDWRCVLSCVTVVPKLRDDDGLDNQSKWSILCIMIPRFSTLPVVVLGIIVITGPFLLYLLEDDLNLTLASLYGKALLAKLIIKRL